MKTFTVSAQLEPLLARMSRDMAVPVEGLVNQAIFNWARLHGYAASGEEAPAVVPDEPETGRIPMVEGPESESDWKLASGASFSSPGLEPIAPGLDSTAPSLKKQRRVVLVLKDREVVVDGERFLIGRDVSCDLTIDSARISRQHAILHVGPEVVEVEDLGSSNGTWFGAERIDRRELVDGDEVLFGDTPVRLALT